MRRLSFIFLLIFCGLTRAAEVIPPPPRDHFNDYASVVSQATAQKLNEQLIDFERQTSTQILVAVYPKMQSDSSIEDYTARVMESWKVGLKGKDNGAVLFVFLQDRKMFINTGYGLEGALPDAMCKQIIDQEIAPQFKANNYEAGLTAGVNAMMSAVRGEYKGNGRTVKDSHGPGAVISGGICSTLLPIAIILLIIYLNRSTMYGPRGRRRGWYWGPGYYGGFGGYGNWGGGSWGGGGGSWGGGGGGGSFMGGGGSTGGGGAGGSW